MRGKEKLKNNPKGKQKLYNQRPDTHQTANNQIWLQQCTIPSSQISACKNNDKHVEKWEKYYLIF